VRYPINHLPAKAPEKVEERTQNHATDTNQREQFTRNYEVGRAVNHTKADTAILKRLSLGVVIDAPNDENKSNFEQLTKALKDAVGFDLKRGDSLTLTTYPFVEKNFNDNQNLPWYLHPQILALGKIIVIGIFLLISIILIAWQIRKALRSQNQESKNDEDLQDKDPLPLDPSASYADKLIALQKLANQDSARLAAALKQWLS